MSEPGPGRAAAPSLDDIARLAEEAFAALPDLFRSMAGDIVFRVDDFTGLEEGGVPTAEEMIVASVSWLEGQSAFDSDLF